MSSLFKRPNQHETVLPAFYNDLAQSQEHAWSLLVRSCTDRKVGFHALMVASVEKSEHGDIPRQRTMILRAVDPAARTLTFYTDRRSPKFAQIAQNEHISVCHYDASTQIELRVSGRGTFHVGDPVARAAWGRLREDSRISYISADAPGSVVDSPAVYLTSSSFVATNKDGTDAEQHFSVLVVHVNVLEWLYLHVQGNRRARFSWPDGSLSAQWLQH